MHPAHLGGVLVQMDLQPLVETHKACGGQVLVGGPEAQQLAAVVHGQGPDPGPEPIQYLAQGNTHGEGLGSVCVVVMVLVGHPEAQQKLAAVVHGQAPDPGPEPDQYLAQGDTHGEGLGLVWVVVVAHGGNPDAQQRVAVIHGQGADPVLVPESDQYLVQGNLGGNGLKLACRLVIGSYMDLTLRSPAPHRIVSGTRSPTHTGHAD